MTRLGILVTGVAVGLFGWACQREDHTLAERLNQIDQKLKDIDAKLASGGGAVGGARAAGARADARPNKGARQAPQQRKGPDPSLIYSVDISGAAYEGVKDAKVTIVDAFEFA